MTYFYNAVCPVCEQPLKKEDDIVVCPECGAPYHRACYKQVGQCLYQDKHGTDFAYLPDPTPEAEPQEFVLCPRCGKGNPKDALACDNCGTPLAPWFAPGEQPPQSPASDTQQDSVPLYRRSKQDVQKDAPDPNSGKFSPPPGGFDFGSYFGADAAPDTEDGDEDTMDPMQRLAKAMDGKEKLDDLSLAEWVSFVGPNAPMYVFVFKQLSQRVNGLAMSFSALVLGPVYFAYRKMWLWAAIAMLVRLVCGVPDMLLALMDLKLLGGLGLSAQLLQQLSLYGTYLTMALNLFWGIAAYTLYRQHCIRSINRIKAGFGAEPSEQLFSQLGTKGGVSPVGAAVMIALLVLVNFPLVWALM